jgi:hypothetical protein
MTNRSAWTAGNGAGFTWTAGIATGDLATMPNGSTVFSSIGDITNQASLDMFMDVSVRCAIASSTVVAGANLALFLAALLDDGATYGDGQFTNGTQKAQLPTYAPIAVIPLFGAASQTTLVGFAQQIIIPPGSFRLGLQNNSGFTFSGTQNVKYRTYNLNLNN